MLTTQDKPRVMTIYKLSWGGKTSEAQERFFRPEHSSDAFVRFSECVIELDRDPAIHAAWVHLERLPDSIFDKGLAMCWWTKTSDEHPTRAGYLTADEAERGQ